MSKTGLEPEVINFGCRLNLVESQAIRQVATDAGQQNLIIINSCAVTKEAMRQARQKIRRLKRENPQAKILVTGCAAQTEPTYFSQMAEVDFVIGNREKTQSRFWQNFTTDSEPVQVSDFVDREGVGGFFPDAISGHTRGFLQIQNGCDHRCTFCVIPYGRGPSRSSAMGEICRRIDELLAKGIQEIVLTGVDLTSWGQDLPGTPRLGGLIEIILKRLPKVFRLRLSSLDCIEIDDSLCDAYAQDQRLLPHVHLSLQSGNDLILKRMKRRHNRQEAIDFCQTMRRCRPDLAFGADMIVGFPTEDEAMFADSLALVQESGLSFLHVFPFSPRPLTPAAKMPQVPAGVIKERAARLRWAGEMALQQHLDRQLGRRVCVLMENGGIGHTPDFCRIRVANMVPGECADVFIRDRDGLVLVGERGGYPQSHNS